MSELYSNGLTAGCPIGCRYCMVTHIDSRRERWNVQHRYGINKTVLFVNRLPDEPHLREMDLCTDFFRGEYVGFEGITDAFNPKLEDDLDFMLQLSCTVPMKKLALVTKWPLSNEQIAKLAGFPKVSLTVSLTGLDMLERVTTAQKLSVIRRARAAGIDVFPIVHPYIHGVSDLSFMPALAAMGVQEIGVKGLRYNDRWMGDWAKELMPPEVYAAYMQQQETELLLGEDHVRETADRYGLQIVSFRERLHRPNGVPGLPLGEAVRIVDRLFQSGVTISSSDTDDAVWEEAVRRRLQQPQPQMNTQM